MNSKSNKRKSAKKKAGIVYKILLGGFILLFAILSYNVISDIVRGTFGWGTVSVFSFIVVFPATWGVIRLIDQDKKRQSKYFDEHGVSVDAESEIVDITKNYTHGWEKAKMDRGRYFTAYTETRYKVGERTFTIKDEMPANKKMKVGDRTTFPLRIDPDRPEWTEISPPAANPEKMPLKSRLLGIVCLILLLAAIVFVFAGVVLMPKN